MNIEMLKKSLLPSNSMLPGQAAMPQGQPNALQQALGQQISMPATAAQTGEAWDFLPKEMSALQTAYANPQDFWAEVGRFHSQAEERRAMGQPPMEGASQQEWTEFWNKLGRPANPDGYNLPQGYAGKDIPVELALGVGAIMDESRQEFMQVAHKANLTQKQAETLYALAADAVAATMATQQTAQGQAQNSEDHYEILTQLWPKDTMKHLDFARRGARSLGIGGELDSTGLSTHPLVLRLAHALGLGMAEDPMRSAGGGDPSLPVGDAAYKELLRVVASDAYKRQDAASVRLAEQLSVRTGMKE